MHHTNNPIIKHKAGLLNLAEEGGIDALVNQNRRVPNLKNRADEATERAVVEYAVEFPAHGQHRTSNELRKKGVFISGSGVRSIWQRYDLENFRKRLKALEAKVAREGIVLTDAQIAALEKKAHDDVAKLLGTTQSTVSQWESSSNPQKRTREKLADIYQCRIEQMTL